MTKNRITLSFQHWDNGELRLCRALNRRLSSALVEAGFRVVSRLGDGVFWYALMVSLPLSAGWPGLHTAVRMAGAGVVGVLLYKVLKTKLARERPYITFDEICCGTPPLDRYSFPSGHTLHAVCFSTIALHEFPSLAIVLVPFTGLVMLSRVVLGLHYPSDVAAGAVLGYALGRAAVTIFAGA